MEKVPLKRKGADSCSLKKIEKLVITLVKKMV